MSIGVTRKGLVIDGKPRRMMSGTLHYWRLDPAKWEDLLRLVAGMGFEIVETYIPWSVHELGRGRFDFGDRDRSRDLDRFLSLVHKLNLKILLRPGPHINAELTYFGYPRRVLEDRACQSISADGDPVWLPVPPKMFPAPSYASRAFYDEVGIWYDAVCKVITKNLHPHGPVIAVQVDNEFCNMFRNSPYDHDYHPDAVALFHTFLQEKYRGIDGLNRAYAADYNQWSEVQPLREYGFPERRELPRYLDFIEFREYYMQAALKRLRGMLEERGITGVPIFHNYPTGYDLPPNNYTRIESVVDFQGPDMYPARTQYDEIKSLAQYASGLSRFPYSPEFGSGSAPWNVPLSLDDQRFTTPALLMHGIKGVNFYMIVERERWYGSPVTRDGRKRGGHYEFYQDINMLTGKLRINELDKVCPALLLSNRDYQRLAEATTVLDPLPLIMPSLLTPEMYCAEDRFGFPDVIQIDSWLMYQSLRYGLCGAKITFDCGNTGQPLDALQRYGLVLVSTYGFLSSAVQQRLKEYAESGGTLVIGPRLPELDENMKTCTILKDACSAGEALAGEIPAILIRRGKGRIIRIQEQLPGATGRDRPEKTSALMIKIAELAGIERPFIAAEPEIDTVLHRDNSSQVLFIANPTSQNMKASIGTCGASLADVQNNETFAGDPALVPLAAYSVRIMEVKS